MPERESERGRWEWTRGVLVLLAVFAVGMIGRPPAHAVDARVAKLQALCEAPAGLNRKAMAIAELAATDSQDARNALLALATCKDERASVLVLAALGREGFSGATAKLESVMGDTKRSHLARAGALAARCERARRDEKTWSEISGTIDAKIGSDTKLDAMAEALRERFWSSEGGE